MQRHSNHHAIFPASLCFSAWCSIVDASPSLWLRKKDLSNEEYGNNEAGVILTCYAPGDSGTSGRQQDCNLYLNSRIYFTTFEPAVLVLW